MYKNLKQMTIQACFKKEENVQESEADDDIGLLKNIQKLPGNIMLQKQIVKEQVMRGDNSLKQIEILSTNDEIFQAIRGESQEEGEGKKMLMMKEEKCYSQQHCTSNN